MQRNETRVIASRVVVPSLEIESWNQNKNEIGTDRAEARIGLA